MAARAARPREPKPKRPQPLEGWPLKRELAVRESDQTKRMVLVKMRSALRMPRLTHTIIYLLIRGLHGKTRPEMKRAFADAVGRRMEDLGWGPNGEDLPWLEPAPIQRSA